MGNRSSILSIELPDVRELTLAISTGTAFNHKVSLDSRQQYSNEVHIENPNLRPSRRL
jgi:hypothetical protein